MAPQPEQPTFQQNNYGHGNAMAQHGNAYTYNIGVTYQDSPPRHRDAQAVLAARQRLATLPLATIPAVAPLPQPSRMDLKPNRLFIGRDEALRALATALCAEDTTDGQTRTAAVSGFGGLGKTQLASEFAHRYGQFFAGVFWLSFATDAATPGARDDAGQAAESSIVTQVTACGRPGYLDLGPGPVYDTLQLSDQVRKVLGAWQSGLPYLLVFDNCEDEVLLDQWQPPTGACRVLVTSRRAEWSVSLGVTLLALDTLRRPDSIALLHKHRPDLAADDPDLDAIAAELGDLPLALHLAGSYLQDVRFDLTPADYLRELRNPTLLQHESLQGTAHADADLSAAPLPTKHERSVARTFALSYDRLDMTKAVDARARAVLVRAAYFAPGTIIPRPLLWATLEEGVTPAQFGQAVRRLTDLGLLEVAAAGGLRLHRLLAAFVHDVPSDAHTGAQAAVERAVLQEVRRLNATGEPARMATVQAHLRAVTDAAMHRPDEQAAALCAELGYYLSLIGAYGQARPYLARVLAICEQALGPAHPDTATSLNNLANLLQAQGDLAAARPLFERALAIRKQALGPVHPTTAQSLNNLASLLYAQGDLAAARPLFERLLSIRQQMHDAVGEAAAFLNLGYLAAARGRVEDGACLVALCVVLDARINHPDVPRDLAALTALTAQLHYAPHQVEGLLQQAADAYQTDRGWGVVTAEFETYRGTRT